MEEEKRTTAIELQTMAAKEAMVNRSEILTINQKHFDKTFTVFFRKAHDQKVAYLNTVVKYLEQVLRSINNRTFLIKNAIEWKKFTSGAI